MLGWVEELRRCQHHAARQVRGVDAGEIQRGTLTGDGLLGCGAMHLHAAHTHQLSAGMDLHFLILVHRPRNERAGDDRAEAFHGEDAIDGQAKGRGRIFRRSFGGQTRQLLPQLVEARTGLRTHRDDGRVSRIEERALEEIGSLHPHDVQRLRINQVGFGDHGYAAPQGEHAADIEVLAGLRLDRLVSRDHQQDNIDAADAGQHVADKALVAGHIDETDANGVATGADQIEVGEAEIDGDAAPLLLGQPVGIDAGKGAYQRTLAMVDMTCGPNDDSLHIEQFNPAFVELCWRAWWNGFREWPVRK